MVKRVLSAIVLIPLVIAAVFLAPPLAFSIVITVLGAINFYELLQMGRTSWPGPPPWLSLAGSAVAGFVVSHPVCPEFRTLGVVLFFLFQACLSVLYSEKVEEIFGRVVLPVAGFVYIYVFFSFVYEIRFALVPGRGAWLLIAFLAMQWVGDTFAFLAGSAFGRHKLRPLLSPKKSVEGTVGGLIGSAAVGAVAGPGGLPGAALVAVRRPRLLHGRLRAAGRPAGVAVQAGVRGEGFLPAHPRPRRTAGPDGLPAPHGPAVLPRPALVPVTGL